MIAHWPPHAIRLEGVEADLPWARALGLFSDLPAPDYLTQHTDPRAVLTLLRLPLGGDGRQFVVVALVPDAELSPEAVAQLAARAAGLIHPEAPDHERLLLFVVDPAAAYWVPMNWTASYDAQRLTVTEVGERVPVGAPMVTAIVRMAAERRST